MGNIIVAEDGTAKKSILGDTINEWAKHKYHDGMNYENNMIYGSTGINPKYDDLLMKRACCTGQTSMNIALPNAVLSEEGDVIGISTVIPDEPAILTVPDGTGDRMIVGGKHLSHNVDYRQPYIPIKIKLFDSSFDLTSKCMFEGNNLYSIKTTDTGGFQVTPSCTALYKGEAHNKGFCEHVEHDRAKRYTTDTQIAYGPFLDDRSNVYADCNCENSLLRGENRNIALVDNNSGRPMYNVNDEILAQFFDKRCFSIGTAGFKPLNAVPQNLCINIDQTKNMSADAKSTINKSQTCNLTNSNTINDNYSGIDPKAPEPTTYASPRAPPNKDYLPFKKRTLPAVTTTAIVEKKHEVSKGVIIGTATGGSVMGAIIIGVGIYFIVRHVRKRTR